MEKRDLYDENKKVTGKWIYKGDEIPDGYHILIVISVMENKDGKYLIQKRSDNHNWALTGGHPKYGETSIEGIVTEIKEELGIDISNEDIKLIQTRTFDKVICDLYYINADYEKYKYNLQKEEVEDIKYMTKEEILEMIDKNQFQKSHGKIFKDYLYFTQK